MYNAESQLAQSGIIVMAFKLLTFSSSLPSSTFTAIVLRWASITTSSQIETNIRRMATTSKPWFELLISSLSRKSRERATGATSWNHHFTQLINSSFDDSGLTGWQFTQRCVLQPFGAPTKPKFEKYLLKSHHDTYCAKKILQQPTVRALHHPSQHRWSEAIAQVVAPGSFSNDLRYSNSRFWKEADVLRSLKV